MNLSSMNPGSLLMEVCLVGQAKSLHLWGWVVMEGMGLLHFSRGFMMHKREFSNLFEIDTIDTYFQCSL